MTSRRREVRLMRRTLFQFDLHRFTFIMQMCTVHLVHQIHRRIVIMSFYKYPILARKRERHVPSVNSSARPSIRLFVHFANRRQRGLVADRFATEALRVFARRRTRERVQRSISRHRRDERRRKILLLDSRVMHKCIDRALAFPPGSLSSLLGG